MHVAEHEMRESVEFVSGELEQFERALRIGLLDLAAEVHQCEMRRSDLVSLARGAVEPFGGTGRFGGATLSGLEHPPEVELRLVDALVRGRLVPAACGELVAGTGLGAFVHVAERELRPSVAEFRRFRVPVAGALEVERDVRLPGQVVEQAQVEHRLQLAGFGTGFEVGDAVDVFRVFVHRVGIGFGRRQWVGVT